MTDESILRRGAFQVVSLLLAAAVISITTAMISTRVMMNQNANAIASLEAQLAEQRLYNQEALTIARDRTDAALAAMNARLVIIEANGAYLRSIDTRLSRIEGGMDQMNKRLDGASGRE